MIIPAATVDQRVGGPVNDARIFGIVAIEDVVTDPADDRIAAGVTDQEAVAAAIFNPVGAVQPAHLHRSTPCQQQVVIIIRAIHAQNDLSRHCHAEIRSRQGRGKGSVERQQALEIISGTAAVLVDVQPCVCTVLHQTQKSRVKRIVASGPSRHGRPEQRLQVDPIRATFKVRHMDGRADKQAVRLSREQ